jgi:hypothetical protein
MPADEFERKARMPPRSAVCLNAGISLKIRRFGRRQTDKGPAWERIVARHGLQAHRYEQIAGWAFGDLVFGSDYDIISDVGKARRAGFCESVDSERMFLDLFARFRGERIIA